MPNPNISAGDWTRLKRLIGAKTSGSNPGGDLVTNRDINPSEAPRFTSLSVPYEGAGTSRILRPASKWSDFVASNRSDFVTKTRSVTTNATSLLTTSICGCSTRSLLPRVGLCRSCTVAI